MSYVNPQDLRSRLDTSLPSYSRDQHITGVTSYKIDTYALWGAYWLSVYVRNSSKQPMYYMTAPYAQSYPIMQDSEYVVQGWGSYLEVGAAKEIDCNLSFNLVNRADAVR